MRLLLVNAIHFKAAWEEPFPTEMTVPSVFHLLDESTVEVPMMWHPKQEFRALNEPGLQAVELPYANTPIVMVVFLPEDLRSFESSLDPETLELALQRLQPAEVMLRIPKFRVDSEMKLKETLSSMGLADLFDQATDLRGISNEPGFRVDEVLNSSFVEVNEAGTEAAAATVVQMIGAWPSPLPKIDICIDRPFRFIIRDKPTGCVLFAGRVEDPR